MGKMEKKEQVKKIIAANVLLKGTSVFPFDFSAVADEIDALYSNPPSPEMVAEKYYWWCPTCKCEVGGQNVTHEEFHDVCGTHVEAKFVPSLEPPEKVREINPYWTMWGNSSMDDSHKPASWEKIIYKDEHTTYVETELSRVYEEGQKAQIFKLQQAGDRKSVV